MQSKYLKFQALVIVVCMASWILSACSGTASPSAQDDIITIGVVNQFVFFEPILDGFKEQMTESGFIEGEDIVYIYNEPLNFDPAAIQQEIDTLLPQDIDLFLTLGSSATAAVNAILEENDLYAVFAPVTNPEKQGLVNSLISPGGRITGINIGGPIIRKSLEWLLTVAPNRQRVHVFYLTGERLAPPQLEDLQITSDELNIELLLHELETPEDAVSIVESMSPDTDVIFTIASQLDDTTILPLAVEKNIAIGTSSSSTANIVTGPRLDYVGIGRQSALLAQQIIRGADAGTLPVEPAQYILLLNLEFGESIGLNIPDSVVQQAGDLFTVEPVAEITPEATEDGNGS